MNIIKGLITKDLLQLKTYRKTLIMFLIIFSLTSFSQAANEGMANMIITMMALGFGMFAVATFNYDESNKADKFILTLPLTKKEVVLAKYILVICSTIIGTIVGMILSFGINLIVNKNIGNIYESIIFSLGTILGIGLVEAIQIPCIYKWGVEKGRLLIFVFAAGGGILIGGIAILFTNLNIPLNNVLNIISTLLPLIFLLLIIVLYYISYKISCRIYLKRDV